jgi:hypothetical protein
MFSPHTPPEKRPTQEELARINYESLSALLARFEAEVGYSEGGTVPDPAPDLRQGLLEMEAHLDRGAWREAMQVAWRLYGF